MPESEEREGGPWHGRTVAWFGRFARPPTTKRSWPGIRSIKAAGVGIGDRSFRALFNADKNDILRGVGRKTRNRAVGRGSTGKESCEAATTEVRAGGLPPGPRWKRRYGRLALALRARNRSGISKVLRNAQLVDRSGLQVGLAGFDKTEFGIGVLTLGSPQEVEERLRGATMRRIFQGADHVGDLAAQAVLVR